jgi:hypothetical protein
LKQISMEWSCKGFSTRLFLARDGSLLQIDASFVRCGDFWFVSCWGYCLTSLDLTWDDLGLNVCFWVHLHEGPRRPIARDACSRRFARVCILLFIWFYDISYLSSLRLQSTYAIQVCQVIPDSSRRERIMGFYTTWIAPSWAHNLKDSVI